MELVKTVNVFESTNEIMPSKTQTDDILNTYFPIGTVYFTSVDRNPEEFLVGKWKRIAQGRVIVASGSDDSVSSSIVINAKGGEYKHKLTMNEMAKHTHSYWGAYPITNATTNGIYICCTGVDSRTSSEVGNDAPHNNIQPYVVKYIWERYE